MTNEQLVVNIQQGSSELLEDLYIKNLGIIKKISRRMATDKEQFDDLTQESYFALLRAVKKFDSLRGFKFITFFTLVLRWDLLRYKDKVKNDELLILNSRIKEDSDQEKIDLVADDRAADPFDNIEWSYFQYLVQKELQKIPELERTLVFKHFGKGVSQKYLANKYNLSKAEAANHINRATLKLRKNSSLKEIGQDYGIISLYKSKTVEEQMEELMKEIEADREWLLQRNIKIK